MISDLLMLIKAQEPVTASEANRCDLFSQVSGAVDDLAGTARDAGVQVRVGGKSPVMIHGEADQIRMAVRKMVENAIVYSHPGGAVGVSVALSSDGKNAVVRVIDHGEGVPKADLPRIFERFYRGSNQNERTTDGIGLGLAIVKHAALAHHGDVTHMMSNCSTSSPHASSIALTISATDHSTQPMRNVLRRSTRTGFGAGLRTSGLMMAANFIPIYLSAWDESGGWRYIHRHPPERSVLDDRAALAAASVTGARRRNRCTR